MGVSDVQFASQLLNDYRLVIAAGDNQLGLLNSFIKPPAQIPLQSVGALNYGEHVQAHRRKHRLSPGRMPLGKRVAAFETLEQIR